MQSFLVDDIKERDKKLLRKMKSTGGKSSKVNNNISIAINNAESYFPEEVRNNYTLIENEGQLNIFIDKCLKNRFVALDTESDVDSNKPDPIEDTIVGISLYTYNSKSCYIPINHVSGNNIDKKTVKKYLEKLNNCNMIYHNAKYDIRVIYNNFNIWLNVFWDTMIAACYLNEEESHGLKPLYDKYISTEEDSSSGNFNTIFGNVNFSMIPLHIAKCYAAKDAQITMELFEFQYQFLKPESPKCEKKGLVEAGLFLRNFEIPLITVVAKMEQEGLRIDIDYVEQLLVDYEDKKKEIEGKLYNYINSKDLNKIPKNKMEKLSTPININSPAQLSIILYDLCKFSNGKHKNGSTGVEVLKYLLNRVETEEDKEFIQNLLDYREVNKLLTTYIKKLPTMISKHTNKLHANFNLYGTKTGRFSSNNPNLQNIPAKNKEIRKMFIAPEGHYMISADYSQQEPRVLAHLSEDKNLIKAYNDGKDLYAMMSSIIYNKSYDDSKEHYPDGSYNKEGKERRDKIKSMILGLMYGMGTTKMAERLGMEYEDAQKFINDFFNKFPNIQKLIKIEQENAYKNGFVTTVYGRKRRLFNLRLPEYEFKYSNKDEQVPEDVQKYFRLKLNNQWRDGKNKIHQEAKDKGIKIIDNGGKIADAERQVLNSIIQGTSADITKKAMYLIGTDKKLKDCEFKLLMTVHDEIIGVVPKEHIDDTVERIEKLMKQASEDKISVPMKIDMEITDRWYGENIEG